jgi:alpha-1,3-rhamnosyl/mannosyltransferase
MPRWARAAYWRYAFRGKVFHAPNYLLPQYADNAVVTVHDLSVFKFPETHPVERVRQFERDFSRSMSQARHLITDSHSTRQEVMDYLGWPADKITAVPLGVALQFKPATDPMRLAATLSGYGLAVGGYTLCVSTLEPRKKIDKLLQAYECLPQSLRERFPLLLVGSYGWLSDHLHQEVARLSGQGWLRYLGFVPEAALPALYAGARSFVYPSTYEGFGLPVLEAMASGVPVVTSNRSCLPELAGGAALLVDPDDVEALVLAVRRCLEDVSWRDAAIVQGLARAKNFSWSECMDQTAVIYRGLS